MLQCIPVFPAQAPFRVHYIRGFIETFPSTSPKNSLSGTVGGGSFTFWYLVFPLFLAVAPYVHTKARAFHSRYLAVRWPPPHFLLPFDPCLLFFHRGMEVGGWEGWGMEYQRASAFLFCLLPALLKWVNKVVCLLFPCWLILIGHLHTRQLSTHLLGFLVLEEGIRLFHPNLLLLRALSSWNKSYFLWYMPYIDSTFSFHSSTIQIFWEKETRKSRCTLDYTG